MVALAAYEADVCSGCGGRLSETTAEQWGVSARIYEVQPPATCHKCVELDVAGERTKDHEHRSALRFHITEKTRPSRDGVSG